MPFALPSFPLTCNIWTHYQVGVSTYASPDLQSICNLTPGKRVMISTDTLRIYSTDGHTVFGQIVEILFPKGQLVSAGSPLKPPSMIECPAGSSVMFYAVYVDDIGKGFANEHRYAMVRMVNDNVVFSDLTASSPPGIIA